MRIKPVEHKFGSPKPYPISFMIYKESKTYNYSPKSFLTIDYGEGKNGYIQIRKNYINNKLCSKLFYIKDKSNNWIKSILKYIDNGKQWKILRSEAK